MASSTALQARPDKRTGKAGSTVFLKALMAVSGLFFVLFVLAHMYGNLKLFAGRESFNGYSEHLRTIGEPLLPRHGLLTIMEALLIVALIAHVYSALTLWMRAHQARPVRYRVKKTFQASLASRTMRWGGTFLLLFIVWHLIHFTFFKVNPAGGPSYEHDLYSLVVASFGVWWMTLIYCLAMLALGMHLWHGVWSASQTLGWTSSPAARRNAKAIAAAVALITAIGFVVPPLFVLFGVIK